jgi:hypothetical protein
LKFIVYLQVKFSQLNLRSKPDGSSAGQTYVLPIKSFPGGFFNRIHHEEKISVQRALHHLAGFAGAVSSLIGAYGTDVTPDGVDVNADIVTAYGLNGLCDFGEQAEQGAPGGLLQATLSVDGALGANVTDLITDNRL